MYNTGSIFYNVLNNSSSNFRFTIKPCDSFFIICECPDDCGAWQQGKNSTKTNVFIKSGETLHFVVTSVVTVKRKYLVLDRNSNYKKRITWFDCEPEITTTVVEYIVEYTTSVVHGNALQF
jgi:hypothetical protein